MFLSDCQAATNCITKQEVLPDKLNKLPSLLKKQSQSRKGLSLETALASTDTHLKPLQMHLEGGSGSIVCHGWNAVSEHSPSRAN